MGPRRILLTPLGRRAASAAAAAAAAAAALPCAAPGRRRGVARPDALPSVCACDGGVGGGPLPPRRPARVLIVGGGLTGCLTAAFIQRRWKGDLLEKQHGDTPGGAAPPSPPRPDPAPQLAVWERASYPAGRFGARAVYGHRVADLGSQVLSVVDSSHENSGGGHGVDRAAVELAEREALAWVSAGELRECLPDDDDSPLAPTEERFLWPGLWRHFWAPKGLTSILQGYLGQAGCECLPHSDWPLEGESARNRVFFGRRADEIQRQPDGRWRVLGVDREMAERSGAGTVRHVSDVFDVVVLCLPAPDVLKMEGVTEHLPRSATFGLSNVSYDARLAGALFFGARGRLHGELTRRFGSSAELCLDLAEAPSQGQPAHGVHLLALQEAKAGRRAEEEEAARGSGGQASPCCCVVVHSCTDPRSATRTKEEFLGDAVRCIAAELGVPHEVVEREVLHTKVVDWQVAQLSRNFEAVAMQFAHEGGQAAEVGGGDHHHQLGAGLYRGKIASECGRLIVAGDFLTLPSFLGCVATAAAAASAVCDAAGATAAARAVL